MKKTKTINGLLVGTMLLSTIAPLAVSAEENQTKGTHTGSIKLSEGDFILETSPITSFGSHKIEKEKKTVSASFDKEFFVTDARGTQQGWDVTVSATPFTIVEPAGGWVKENPYSLPLGSLTLEQLSSITGVYGERKEIHPTASTLGVAIDLGQEVKIANALKEKGMGKYALKFGADALKLVIDPTTAKIDKVNYPDTVTPYEATITWNLISGPGTSSAVQDEVFYGEGSNDLVYGGSGGGTNESITGSLPNGTDEPDEVFYDSGSNVMNPIGGSQPNVEIEPEPPKLVSLTETYGFGGTVTSGTRYSATDTIIISNLDSVQSIKSSKGTATIVSVVGNVLTYKITNVPVSNKSYEYDLTINYKAYK